jgi:peroxiredoxin
MVEQGEPAPTFTLSSDGGEDVPLESFRGKPVVLHFPFRRYVRMIDTTIRVVGR